MKLKLEMKKIEIIAAMSENGVIGRGGRLPWQLKSDLQRFKKITTGFPIIMGRATFEDIMARGGKPLPNRIHMILSSQSLTVPDGCFVYPSLQAALDGVVSSS